LATCVALGFALPAAAAGTAAQGDARMAGVRVSATGTVTAVDTAKRMVTVRNEEGAERSFHVDTKVQGLENVKAGDKVQLDYVVALAVTLRKGGDGIREKVEADAEVQDPQGGKPGEGAGKRTTIVTNVLAVDRAKQTVRLQGPEGRVADFEVKDKAALDEVKVGDQVVAVVYEAVAVGVKPAAP